MISSSKAERQVILFSAGTAARRWELREQTRDLVARLNWSRLADTLSSRKLLTVVGPRILELSEGRAPEDFVEVVERAIRAGRRQGAFLQLISLRLMSMLAQADIRCAPLKGPWLGETIYGDPGRRLSSDIDLLVPPEEIQAAVKIVAELGYAAPTDYIDSNGLPLLHFALLHEHGQLPPVELHWRVHWYEGRFARERLLPPAVDPVGDWNPAPIDEFAALLLFYARDGFIDLRIASDLSAWWDVYGADFPPGALDGLLGEYPELARVILASAAVAENVVGLPAADLTRVGSELGFRGRAAVRLANPHPRSSQSQLYADMGLIDALLMPQKDLCRFVRRQLIPPVDVREEQARHGARRRARSPVGRAAGILLRYGRTITRLILALPRQS